MGVREWQMTPRYAPFPLFDGLLSGDRRLFDGYEDLLRNVGGTAIVDGPGPDAVIAAGRHIGPRELIRALGIGTEKAIVVKKLDSCDRAIAVGSCGAESNVNRRLKNRAIQRAGQLDGRRSSGDKLQRKPIVVGIELIDDDVIGRSGDSL